VVFAEPESSESEVELLPPESGFVFGMSTSKKPL